MVKKIKLSKKTMDKMFELNFNNFHPTIIFGLPPQASKYLLKKYKVKLDENGNGIFEHNGTKLFVSFDGVRCKVRRADDVI